MDAKEDSSAASELKTRLGRVLVDTGRITQEQLEEALGLQTIENRKLGEVLIERGLATAEDIATALSLQLNLPLIDLKRHVVQPNALKLVSERVARKHVLIPLDVAGDALVVVMADPTDIVAIQDVSVQAEMRVQPAVGIPQDIQEAIDLNYKAISEIEQEVGQFAFTTTTANKPTPELEDAISHTPVVRTVDLLIAQALKERASDIHIEPQEDRTRVRYRVDGVLHDAMSLPKSALESLISRVKILADMNIAERRRPQDGQFSIKGEGWEADIRAATYDTGYGETVVMRLLDKSLPLFALNDLGMRPEVMTRYLDMLKCPYGMILVAGPTGSGKTTTLYSSINQLDRHQKNIITIEDPIEYQFSNLKQTQVNVRADITFATGMRALMRLDPDVILVGEIRDGDTAKMAIQAALTGHLVLSSIHANDVVGVLFRLMDLGVEPYLIASAVIGVVAQRMIRLICSHCREPYEPPPGELDVYRGILGEGAEPPTFYHGYGCNLCAQTGYLKRTGVYEVMPISEESRQLFLKGAAPSAIRSQGIEEGMVPLKVDGMLKVKNGLTTTEEVLRNVFSIG